MGRFLCIAALLCVLVIVAVPSGIALLIGSPNRDREGIMSISLYDSSTGAIRRMTLQEYLVGVVAAEMPASFGYEALKAQAVAARTYTIRRIIQNREAPCDAHRGADMCSDPGHCQAWCSREELVRKWGVASYISNVRTIIGAVADTDGLVMTYQGQLIDAVYHSCCGGVTEDAADVWGRKAPYLVPVRCDYEGRAGGLTESKTFTSAQLIAALGIRDRAVPTLSSGVRVAATTPTARASVVSVYGVPVLAADLRRALSLKSTALAVRSDSGKVTFTTRGYGHGVGMCQWGADGMAAAGISFDRILLHYYTGVQIQRIRLGPGE
ncbi:MAG: stage II sporulation protein D [Clostridia bacterium]|nr:stage II sporulation protein D [Clostridia bacterium]